MSEPISADEAVEELKSIDDAHCVLDTLVRLDKFSFRKEEYPYPIPMAGPDFVTEVAKMLLKRLKESNDQH